MILTYFEIHLVEHCNLKCQSCDNFSPLAKPEFITVKSFDAQMKQMASLANNQITKIRLLGGEPLLHPRLNSLLTKARTHFPNAQLLLTTNAILLNDMPKDFWTTCHDNNITIEVTYYPIKIDRAGYTKLSKEYDVKIIPFDGKETNTKVSHRNPINDKKDQPITNYNRCYQKRRHSSWRLF